MAITAGLSKKFVQEALKAAVTAGHTVKLAFYADTATIGPDTQTYTATGEVTNSPNIPAGGVTLSGYAFGDGAQTVGYLDWSDLSLTVVGTFTARGAMLYNASNGNQTIANYDFGANKTATDGPFQVTIPGSGSGCVRFSST
jgi:hypothetical protein